MATLLELSDIRKSYDDDEILSGVSLTVKKGTAVSIIGNSGGGKTTLLSIIGLLQEATTGKIVVDGIDIGQLSYEKRTQIRREYFGFVFQRARLIHSLTVFENVMVPALISKKGKSFHQKARQLLERFEMTHRLDHKPHQLSLGQMRRVSLARALLLNPPILLADEPTNDLDPELASNVTDSLLEARNNGAGVIIVTHDPRLALRTDKTLRLQDGRMLVSEVV